MSGVDSEGTVLLDQHQTWLSDGYTLWVTHEEDPAPKARTERLALGAVARTSTYW